MKTLFTIALASFFSTSVFAYGEGRLTITVASSKNFQVVVDGRSYNANDDNTVLLQNVRQGSHSIVVYDSRKKNNGRYNDRNRNADVLYSGSVVVRDFQHVDVVVNRFGRALVDERDLRYNDRWNERDDRYDDNNGGYGNSYNRVMADYEFRQLLDNINKQWFGKMKAAEDGVARNYFTSAQVKQLLQLFSSESDKLGLAKRAYAKTIDQKNFYVVYDVFNSQRSRDELDAYVRSRR